MTVVRVAGSVDNVHVVVARLYASQLGIYGDAALAFRRHLVHDPGSRENQGNVSDHENQAGPINGRTLDAIISVRDERNKRNKNKKDVN